MRKRDVMRTLVAMGLIGQHDANIAQMSALPEIIMPHHAVKIHRRCHADITLITADFIDGGTDNAPSAEATSSVASSDEPFGISMINCNSFLLSKGSNFKGTTRVTAIMAEATKAMNTASKNQ